MSYPVVLCACGAEVIPGSLYTDADAAAWSTEHAGHSPARTLADYVSERLRGVTGLREVRPAMGGAVRVEAWSLEATKVACLALVGFDVTEIGWTLFVREGRS